MNSFEYVVSPPAACIRGVFVDFEGAIGLFFRDMIAAPWERPCRTFGKLGCSSWGRTNA